MTTPTREEIERLADELIEPYGENISRRTKSADALLSILADRDRLEALITEADDRFCATRDRMQQGINSAMDKLIVAEKERDRLERERDEARKDIEAISESLRREAHYKAIAEQEADAALSRIAELEKERDEAIADAKEIAQTNLHAAAYIQGQRDGAAILRARIAALETALTPSAETKAVYMGEFSFRFGKFTPNVPWTTIKEIMKAISARAALTPKET